MNSVGVEELAAELTPEVFDQITEFSKGCPTATKSDDGPGEADIALETEAVRTFLENQVSFALLLVALDYAHSSKGQQHYNLDKLCLTATKRVFTSSLGPSLVVSHGALVAAGFSHNDMEFRKVALGLAVDLLEAPASGKAGEVGGSELKLEMVRTFFLSEQVQRLICENISNDQVGVAAAAAAAAAALGAGLPEWSHCRPHPYM